MVSLVECFNLSSCVFECAFSALAPGVVCVIQFKHIPLVEFDLKTSGALVAWDVDTYTHACSHARTLTIIITLIDLSSRRCSIFYFGVWFCVCADVCVMCVPPCKHLCMLVFTNYKNCVQGVTVSPLPGFVGMLVCIHSHAVWLHLCVCVCFCMFVSVCAPPETSSPLPQPVCAVQPSNASYLSD